MARLMSKAALESLCFKERGYMEKSECRCAICSRWVDCGRKDGEPWGFCLIEDLFTYTCKSIDEYCDGYEEGESITLKDWEDVNDPNFWRNT